MSGHSKWNNIKNKKAKGDAARSKIFTKIGREIAVAVKAGGADPNTNSKLYDVVQKAKANNMPNDNITRSIKKASGELSAVDYVEMTYEGYGIGGSAVIVECLTDNKNRTAGDVRCAFDKNGGSLGQTNCVSYMFNRTGVVVAENTVGLDEDSAFELAIESGAEDVTVEDGMTAGGLHDAVASWIAERHPGIKVIGLGVPDKFVEQGTIKELRAECGYDTENIFKTICNYF